MCVCKCARAIDVNKVAIVRPETEFHLALLFIVRKPFDVDLTKALVDGRWLPYYLAIVIHSRIVHDADVGIASSAVVTLKVGLTTTKAHLLYKTMSGIQIAFDGT